jgi:uncharacterized membrane protein YhiD involved in acid resistance
MLIDIPNVSVATGILIAFLTLCKTLFNQFIKLNKTIELTNKSSVPHETFNEFKQDVNKAFESLNIIKITQAKHEEHLQNQDKMLNDIKDDMQLLKKKVYS